MRRSAVLIAFMGLVATASPAWGVAGFGDVEPDRFFTTPVQWMVDEDITTGTSRACFSPDEAVTRGQAAAFLWRMEGFPVGAPPHPFTDVVAPWQQAPVSWMADEGITTGTTPTTYSPDDTLTRGQMAALIHRAAGEPGGAPPHPFTDVVRDWQQVPVSWMADEGITTGTTPTTFSPDDPVTRGQFAAFAHRWKGEPAVVLDETSPLCLGIDHFDGALQQGWEWNDDDPAKYSFTTMPGYLTVTQGGEAEADFPLLRLLRDPVADDYVIETKVNARPGGAYGSGGLVVLPTDPADPDSTEAVTMMRGIAGTAGTGEMDGVWLNNTISGDENHGADAKGVALANGTGDVWLRIEHADGTYTGSYSLDGVTWTEVGSFDRDFVSPRYGIGAGISAEPVVADFDYFMETPG